MRPKIYKRGPLVRYGFAVAAVVIAVLGRYALSPAMGTEAQYVTIFPAILIVAVLAGRNPAILAGVLGGPAVVLLFRSTIDAYALIEIAIVIGTAILTGWLVQTLHNARDTERQILESIPGMVFTTRPDGYCDYQSQQWVDYTGVPMTRQLGDGWNKLLHPDDQARAYDAWRAAVEGRAPYDIEYRVHRHDGRYEWFKVRGRPIRCVDGRVIHWFGVAINIDAFRQAQQDLLETKETLENQKKELEAILHIVSHDLRAPLLNIRGFSDILKDDYTRVRELLASQTISEECRKHLAPIFEQSAPEAFDVIEISAKAMHGLIDSLIKVARAGLVFPKAEVVDMNAVLKDIVASIGIGLRETGTTIDVPDLPPCFADPTHVAQVFRNLIDNAIKYRDPARQTCVCVEGASRRDDVVYCVSDNGIGIAPDDEKKIFDIFYRVDGQTGAGEGIGLSVVKRMVERNGGRIWLVSEPGKGSNFFVALPQPPK